MDDSIMEDSIFSIDDDSRDFAPIPAAKLKAKPVAKRIGLPKVSKAPAKKLSQTKIKTAKNVLKKRSKPDGDEDSPSDVRSANVGDSIFSNTPPSAKKSKKESAIKKGGVEPLHDIGDIEMNFDGPSEPKPKKKKDATDQYQKLTQLEHIIKRPDTYIGSVERTESTMWVYNSETQQMEFRKVNFVPGLYKIFDEILVNAADHKQVDPNMKVIKVVIDREKGEISVENDGRGIPVEIHKKEQVYIPEMIFGHLLTGSNYDDDEEKTTGGRNGYGAKLCNIFSTKFTLETQDSSNSKRYKQTWTGNMGNMDKAKISSSKSPDFTRVTFTPDYRRFKMEGIDDDFEALMKRRVYDMAGTVKKVKVYLNGIQIKLDFKKYMEMYAKAINKERDLEAPDDDKVTVIVENSETHDKWEVGFAVSDGSFQQVSFVNSIATTSGGTHVNYIADQICEKLMDVVKKKNSKGAALKINQIRNHIFLFVNCLIVNPAFTSQTKEQLTTRIKQFGSKCVLTDKFLREIAKTDAVQNILSFAQAKADQVLAKSDGNKRSRMNNPKLVDANLAGTRRGHECTLILTEGDSAKGLAVAGRAILDPDRIGVFPLRGKLLNVRDATIDQISKNAEIQNIKQFLGLKHKQVYKETTGLRYGHLMIMADQDHDGSHIKGLLINFLQVQFPSLLKLPDFFREFITPIVKVWKGSNPKKPIGQKSFFTMPQYEEWKERHRHDKGWKYKYFKGLGTSLPGDAQVYFSNLDEHLREFEAIKPEEEELIDLAFSKKKADARKLWLGNFIPGTYLDHSTKTLTYDNFVNKELILFSMADNLRSIPSVIDGLKPGQRKVMYACFKRNLTRDMKVSELGGYVSENTAYHHGDVSMHQTIIGLAQNFVGSNNINCLEPSGFFGSRLAGGSDAASPRYIFTRLSPFARRVFSALDEPLYEHNTDDGRVIEPTMYCPVVPMVLINGADGIGTGWSTTIPNYHPEDVVKNLKRRMGRLNGEEEEKPFETMTPWFRGWKGTPEEAGPMRYQFDGVIRNVSENEVEITELPIRMWTDDFKAKLEDIIKAEKVVSFIKDYKEYNDHNSVHFVIQLDEKHMKPAIADGMLERFKLKKTVATSNLVAFDSRGQIRKYEKVEDILEEYYSYRLDMYTKRRAYWLEKMDTEYRNLKNQARFVLEIIDNKLVVSRKKKPVLVAELRKRGYDPFSKVKDAQNSGETDDVVENEDEEDADEDSGARDFDYLLGLPIWSLTQERVEKLQAQMFNKKEERDKLEKLSEKDLWCQDLDDFLAEWENQLKEEDDYQKTIHNTNRRASRKIGAGGKATGRVRQAKGDPDYNPSKSLKGNSGKGVVKAVKPENKTNQKFIDTFMAKSKPKKEKLGSDGVYESDISDNFEALVATKPIDSTISRSASEQLGPSKNRSRRAAAAAPRIYTLDDDDEESDGEDIIGDIDNMVKGITSGVKLENTNSTGRMSTLFTSRPGSSHGTAAVIPKLKSKPSRGFGEGDREDDTNYEMLARSSPQKSAALKDPLHNFLSDDSELIPVTKKVPVKTAAKKTAKPFSKPKKVATAPPRTEPAEPRPVGLSPSTKVYAAKHSKSQVTASSAFSDDDDDVEINHSPPPKPISRAKPNIISDDEDAEVQASPPPKPVARHKLKAQAVSRKVISDDDDDDLGKPVPAPSKKSIDKAMAQVGLKKKAISDDGEDDDVIPQRSVGRGRPARFAAAAKSKKSMYIDSEEDEMDVDDPEEYEISDRRSEDDFGESD